MAYYKDPTYQQEARLAVIALGYYFTARQRLRQALDLPLGAPGRWFDGSLPSPPTLARIQTFLHLAAQVDKLSKDPVQTGRFFAGANFGRQTLDDPAQEGHILAQARAYFHSGAPPFPRRSQWQAPLTAKHPKLFEALEPDEDSALGSLLGSLV